MDKGFEERFMDMQEAITAACVEALGDSASQVETTCIYAFASDEQWFFHVFFMGKGRIFSYEDLGVSDDTIDRVYDSGMDDVEQITELFREYARRPPNQYRLIYQNQKHTFDSEYDYDDLKSSRLGAMDLYLQWRNEIKHSTGSANDRVPNAE